jgi:hypothetical protein
MPPFTVPLQHQSDPIGAAEVAEVSIEDAHLSRLLIIGFRSRLRVLCQSAILVQNPGRTQRVPVTPTPIRIMQMTDLYQPIPIARRLQSW